MQNSGDQPTNRYFSAAYNIQKAAPNFPYIYDANAVITFANGASKTGNWRPYSTADISNTQLSVSGLNLSVGAVSITGNPGVRLVNNITGSVSISNPVVPVSLTNPVTGSVSVNGGFLGVTGQVTIAGGTSNGSVNITGQTVPLGVNLLNNITGNLSVTNIHETGIVTSRIVSNITGILAGQTVPLGVNLLNSVTGNFSVTNIHETGTVSVNVLNGARVGITGEFSGSLALTSTSITGGYVGITGTPNVNISSQSVPLHVTGNFATTVSNVGITGLVGVTGTKLDINSTYSSANNRSYNHITVGGRAVAVTGAGVLATYTTGDYAILAFNKDNGGLLVNQGALDSTQDTVTIVQSGKTIVSNDGISGANGIALAANTSRNAWFMQNVGTGLLYVRYSTGAASLSAYNFVLKAASSLDNADGGSWSDAGGYYKGAVSVSGTFPRYTVWEL